MGEGSAGSRHQVGSLGATSKSSETGEGGLVVSRGHSREGPSTVTWLSSLYGTLRLPGIVLSSAGCCDELPGWLGPQGPDAAHAPSWIPGRRTRVGSASLPSHGPFSGSKPRTRASRIELSRGQRGSGPGLQPGEDGRMKSVL